MVKARLRVGLILHSAGSDNLGVGALTAAEVDILRDAATRAGVDLQIRILDWKLNREPYVTGPDIEILQMDGKFLASPKGYWAAVRGCDLIVDIGAGDSFADIYGAGRLKRIFWMKYMVHLARRPLALAPQTYGPFTKTLSKWAARASLKRSVVVASRDARSTQAARDLAPGIEVIEASDVALRLPYTAPPARIDGPPKVGLNVSGLLMGGGYTGGNMFGLKMDYPAMIRDLIARLQAHAETPEIHLVPHVAAAVGQGEVGNEAGTGIATEDDRTAALALAREIPGLIVAPEFTSPSEAKSYIATLDFFAGARMHACIGAFSSGVPVVPMAYSRKFAGLFGTLGYDRTVDCTSDPADEIVARIMEGFDDRDTLAAEAEAARALGLEKLGRYEAALERILRDLAAAKR